MQRWLVSAGAMLALVACGGDPGPAPDSCVGPDAGEPALQLGTGEAMFEPLAADQEVPLVAGAQGGYHVWLSMRASGLCAGRNDVRLEVIPSGSARESQSNVRMAFTQVEGEPGVVEQIGWPARVLEPWCAVGDPVRLSVTVTDADGQSAKAAIDVMPVAPAGGFGRTCESP